MARTLLVHHVYPNRMPRAATCTSRTERRVSVSVRLFFLSSCPMRLLLAAGLLVIVLAGCAPTLAPPYFDYAEQRASEPTTADLVGALREAGWTVSNNSSAVSLETDPRTFSQAGVYRVEAHLEVLPMANSRVRVLVHPYRVYFDGARNKIGYLPASLKRAIEPPLLDAMQANGFEAAVQTGNSGNRQEQSR